MNNIEQLGVELRNSLSEIIGCIEKSPIPEIIEFASETSGATKLALRLFSEMHKRRFLQFISGYHDRIAQMSESDQQALSGQFQKYLQKERNMNFIYELIEGIFNSKSVRCCQVLGYFFGVIRSNSVDAGYKEMILLNAFINLNDFELDQAILIMSNIGDWTEIQDLSTMSVFSSGSTIAEYTVQKLKILQIFDDTPAGGIGVPSGKGTFVLNEVAEEFYSLICDSKVYGPS